ncbi:MAG TPA: zinc ribbon domain-containing protein [Armatimonadota bacterium]|nr:zinc ribbon domain-containing protein [Armatimonadota bacterium]
MISEGPNLIEALPGGLQHALNGALLPDEELRVAVRGNVREAFAATDQRLLVLKEPSISGSAPVDVQPVPLAGLTGFRAEARPVGGRLTWEGAGPGAPTFIEFPTYDASKYQLVAQRLQQMIQPSRIPNAPSTPATPPVEPVPIAASRACPKCRAAVPLDGSWCPSCGLQVSDPCWECGRALPQGANYCPQCGTPNTEPAVVQCGRCQAVVGPRQGYCTACGAQARLLCAECERPLRREWQFCPTCGGEPAWEEAGVEPQVAHLTGDEPDDPSAWLTTSPPPAADAERLNQQAVQAFEREDFREAARLFAQAAEADPRNASYRTNLGVALAEAGDEAGALEAYRDAVRLNPGELSAYLNMGYLYNQQERQTEAREMWEKVVALAPDSEEADEARQNLKDLEEV